MEAVCFFRFGKRPSVLLSMTTTNDDRVSLWCPVPLGLQQALVAADPQRLLQTSNVRLVERSRTGSASTSTPDTVDWDEIATIVERRPFASSPPRTSWAELDQR